jgi:hypothetical protein
VPPAPVMAICAVEAGWRIHRPSLRTVLADISSVPCWSTIAAIWLLNVPRSLAPPGGMSTEPKGKTPRELAKFAWPFTPIWLFQMKLAELVICPGPPSWALDSRKIDPVPSSFNAIPGWTLTIVPAPRILILEEVEALRWWSAPAT